MPSDAFRKFEASMVMHYEKRHDGYYLRGRASEPFDWKCPFFLKFNESEKARRAAFARMAKELHLAPGLVRMAHLPGALAWMQNFL
jgi:hypothetical protein